MADRKRLPAEEEAREQIAARAVELAAQAPDHLTAEQAALARRIFTRPADQQSA